VKTPLVRLNCFDLPGRLRSISTLITPMAQTMLGQSMMLAASQILYCSLTYYLLSAIPSGIEFAAREHVKKLPAKFIYPAELFIAICAINSRSLCLLVVEHNFCNAHDVTLIGPRLFGSIFTYLQRVLRPYTICTIRRGHKYPLLHTSSNTQL